MLLLYCSAFCLLTIHNRNPNLKIRKNYKLNEYNRLLMLSFIFHFRRFLIYLPNCINLTYHRKLLFKIDSSSNRFWSQNWRRWRQPSGLIITGKISIPIDVSTLLTQKDRRVVVDIVDSSATHKIVLLQTYGGICNQPRCWWPSYNINGLVYCVMGLNYFWYRKLFFKLKYSKNLLESTRDYGPKVWILHY